MQDYDVGSGPFPVDGQEVQFHYTAYNESGGRIDSSFNKGGGKPSVVRLGINGLIPGMPQAAPCFCLPHLSADAEDRCLICSN